MTNKEQKIFKIIDNFLRDIFDHQNDYESKDLESMVENANKLWDDLSDKSKDQPKEECYGLGKNNEVVFSPMWEKVEAYFGWCCTMDTERVCKEQGIKEWTREPTARSCGEYTEAAQNIYDGFWESCHGGE